MLLFAAAAQAGTVCADGRMGCDHRNLADALDSGDEQLELQRGLHLGGRVVDHRIDLTAVPDAEVMAERPGDAVFEVVAGGTGSTFTGLRYLTYIHDPDGPLLLVRGAAVTATDARVAYASGDAGAPAPGFVVEQGGALELVSPQVSNVVNPGDGTVSVEGSSLVVIGGRFETNLTNRGGAIWARNSDVTILNTEFDGNNAQSDVGNSLWISGGTLSVIDAPFNGPYQSPGSEIELVGVDTATFAGGDFSGNAPNGSSAVSADLIGDLEIVGTRFFSFTRGAVVVNTAERLTVTDAVFEGNRTPNSGGALFAGTVVDLDVAGSWFCGNGGELGGAIRLGNCMGTCGITRSVFEYNDAVVGGAISAASTLSISRSTLVGNVAPGGGAVFAGSSQVGMETSIVIDHHGTDHALDFDEPLFFEWNALGNNQAEDTSFPFPRMRNLTDATVKFVQGAGRCGFSIELTGAPANDWLIEHGVGALLDLDQDGFNDDVDCDDSRPDVHPQAEDLPGDGVDQDCDGQEVCPVDGDGDGFGTEDDEQLPIDDCPLQRGDCRDDDASVFPGAPDAPYDNVDSDCADDDDFDQDGDGVPRDLDCDDTAAGLGDCQVSVGGGCSTAGGGGWLALLLVVGSRRSRVDGRKGAE